MELKRRYATELVGLAPDVIVATGDSNTGPLQEATRMVPIVFALVPDPAGAGFVANLARPGGNVTCLYRNLNSRIIQTSFGDPIER